LLAADLGPQVPRLADAPQQALVADDVRNLMLSPAAGRDAHALYDTEPLARAMLARLQNEPEFAALSPKFSVLLDGGERLAELEHPHDIWLAAMEAADDGDAWFALGLAGQPSTSPGSALAAVRACDAAALAHALLLAFIELAAADQKRMRDLLATHDAHAVIGHAAAKSGVALRRDAAVQAWHRPSPDPARRYGSHAQRQAGLWHVGGQAPLGRMDTAVLRGLAGLALDHAQGALRATPWQGVLVPDVPEASVPHVENELRCLGFVLDARAPLGRLVACAGSAGCGKGRADTKADALELAQRLPAAMPETHLSGCERSCAAARCAPRTLLAVAPGRYDLYQRMQDGASRFGLCIAKNLTIEEAARRLGPSSPERK
jgi:precorrin-3B synthase